MEVLDNTTQKAKNVDNKEMKNVESRFKGIEDLLRRCNMYNIWTSFSIAPATPEVKATSCYCSTLNYCPLYSFFAFSLPL